MEIDREKLDSFYNNNFNEKDDLYVTRLFCNDKKEDVLKHHLYKQFYELLQKTDIERKDLDHILHKIHYDINTRFALSSRRKFVKLLTFSMKMAGVIILAIIVFLGTKSYFTRDSGDHSWIEIKAPAWTRAQFSLPDGTAGWLNSNSTVRYSGNFRDQRRVSVSGEVFFDVTSDRMKPFIVSVNDVELKVLGTRFNVAAYNNEENVEVVLEEGSLVFSNKTKGNSLTMNPNDMIIYNKISNEAMTQLVEPQKYSAWTEGKLVFRNDPLNVVARRLERWYNLEVEVKGDITRDPRLRATFVDETLEEVLDLLNRSLSIDYRFEERNIKSDDTYPKKKLILIIKPRKS